MMRRLGGTERHSKHIFLGEERIVTKVLTELDRGSEEVSKQYYYHGDHLGSAQLVTDYRGNEYQRIEYTPYGQTWIEKREETSEGLPYKFSAKERDEETGLYYYGARYLDPKTSRWLSTDPALGEYIPTAGADNGNLPGMGGVFNTVNFHLYHYAGNNPVKYIDPDGKQTSPAMQPAPQYQSGAPYAYTPPALTNFYDDTTRRGDYIELISATAGIFVSSLAIFIDKVFNKSSGLKNAEKFYLDAQVFFYSLQMDVKNSRLFDFDADGSYSKLEVQAFCDYINNSMEMNYGQANQGKIKPFKVSIPKLDSFKADVYLNNKNNILKYTPEANLLMLQFLLRSEENEN